MLNHGGVDLSVTNGSRLERVISSSMGDQMLRKLVEDWLRDIGEEWMKIISIFKFNPIKKDCYNSPQNNYFLGLLCHKLLVTQRVLQLIGTLQNYSQR